MAMHICGMHAPRPTLKQAPHPQPVLLLSLRSLCLLLLLLLLLPCAISPSPFLLPSPLLFSTMSTAASPRAKPLIQRIGMPLIRILGGLCGCTVIALGVYDITMDKNNISVVVNNIYRILFGLLIIAAELRATSLLRWFSFLTFFFGLGLFYIFVGGLAMGTQWYEVTMAVVLCAMGLLYVSASCACAEHAQEEHDKLETKVIATEKNAAGKAGQPDYAEMEDGASRRGRADPSPFADSSTYEESQAAPSSYNQNQKGGDIDPFAGHNPRGNAYD